MRHSSKSSKLKPAKPYADFPLFPHQSGRWCKKIRGKFYYYGSWEAGADAALAEYLRCKDYDQAGRQRPDPNAAEALTVKSLVNAYLRAQERKLLAGELKQRSFDCYFAAGKILADTLGRGRLVSDLTPDDFGKLRAVMAKRMGPNPLASHIAWIRGIFKFGFTNGLTDRPPKYGDQFSKPSAKVLKRHRAERGRLDFSADEIRAILDAADEPLKTIVLLSINTAFGNHDIGSLPIHAVDLQAGWIEYARPKTGEYRRAKLWPETVAAIRSYLKTRPTPTGKTDRAIMFLNLSGRPWATGAKGRTWLATKFRQALDDAGVFVSGRAFYSLRRTFRTVAGETLDERAVNLVMGHGVRGDDMGGLYSQHIADDRLIRIAEHVRTWLFSEKSKKS